MRELDELLEQIESKLAPGPTQREEVRLPRALKRDAVEAEALTILSGDAPEKESLAAVLKGHAIELWSNSAGKLFLVADDEDGRVAMERYGMRRGEIYTASEISRIVAIRDPADVAEIYAWKRRFDGTLRS
jgi:hypothetical protein